MIEETPQPTKESIKPLHQHILKRIKRNHLILNFIMQNGEVTAYHTSKKLGYDYSTTSKVCRDLEYIGLVLSKTSISENNIANRLYFYPNLEDDTKD